MFDMEVTFPPDADAPASARQAIEGLEPVVGPGVFEETSLLVSELVTNSVRHARLRPDQVIRLQVRADRSRIHVAVIDEGPGFDPDEVGSPGVFDGGWGLQLLRQLAQRWGVGHDGGTVVWFELTTAPAHRQLSAVSRVSAVGTDHALDDDGEGVRHERPYGRSQGQAEGSRGRSHR
jgi:anti-sigma regulatory factor (Ser/Thr protein kinase)